MKYRWVITVVLLLISYCHLYDAAGIDASSSDDTDKLKERVPKRTQRMATQQPKREKKGGRRRESMGKDIGDDENVNWGLIIGTESGRRDVYENSVQLGHAWHPETLPENKTMTGAAVAFTTFWVKTTSKDAVTIMMQRPALFVESEGCEVRLSDWPSSSSQTNKRKRTEDGKKEFHRSKFLSPVPNVDRSLNPTGLWQNETDLHFTVQYACEKTMKQEITMKMRFIQFAADGTRENHNVKVSWIKLCDGTKAVDETQTALPGFFVGTTNDGMDVVKDGIAREAYEIPEKESDDEHLKLISATESASTYYVRYLGATDLQVNAATAVAHDPEILQVVTGGRMSKATQQLGSTAADLELSFRCREAGESIVTVSFKSKDNDRMNVLFAIKKKCAGMTADGGVSIAGLNIGRGNDNKVGEDVMFNGVADSKYAPSLDKKHKRVETPVAEAVTTFWISQKSGEPVTFGTPIATADSPVSTPMASPEVELNGEEVTPKQPLKLQLTYHCSGTGTTDVTVVIPVKPQGNIVIVVRKSCQPSKKEIETERNKQPLAPLPGIMIGYKKTAPSGVAVDGIPHGAWNWNDTDNDLVLVRRNSFLTFYITLNSSVAGAAAVKFGEPVVSQSLPITQPVVSGRGSNGAVVSRDGGTAFSVTFHCLTNGNTTMTVAIPIIDAGGFNGRKEPIRITFLKECSIKADAPTQGLGGIHLPGFHIGTTLNGQDVVKNGFPSPAYFGSRASNWKATAVPANVESSRFYVRYDKSTVAAHDEIGDEITFQSPSIINHRPILAAVASGDAAHGDTLFQGGEPEELDITYHCKHQGLVGVTVTIPILPHGRIVFTIAKLCDGPSLPRGNIVPGLNIGTKPGANDIVKDGVTAPAFVTIGANSLKVDADELMTTFYIQKTGPQVLGLEPEILAHRPVCNPSLDHELHVSDADSDDDDEDTVEIVIGNQTQSINVSYNCVWEDSSTITIALQLLPRGKVQWSWTKYCPDFFSSDIDPGLSSDDDDEDAMPPLIPDGPEEDMPSDDDNTVDDEADDDDEDEDDDFLGDQLSDVDELIRQRQEGLGLGDDYYELDIDDDDTDAPSDDKNDDSREDDDDDDDTDDDTDPEQRARDAQAAEKVDGGDTEDDDIDTDDDIQPVIRNDIEDLNVGTAPYGEQAYDVMYDGVAQEGYAQQIRKGDDETVGSRAGMIAHGRTEVTYYLTIDPNGAQEFEHPLLQVKNPEVVKVTVTGLAASGVTLPTKNPYGEADLTLSFECLSRGRTSILVSLQLKPKDHGTPRLQSFKLVKTCAGKPQAAKAAWYWSIPNIVTFGGGSILVAAAVFFFLRRQTPAKYQQVPTRDRGDIAMASGHTETTVIHDDSD